MPNDAETNAEGSEVKAARAREAAMREILEVISQSRDDDRPVFDAILRSATRLCGADSAALLLGTPAGPHLTLAALNEWNGLSAAELDRFIADINRVPMDMDPTLHVSAQAICSGAVIHIADLAATEGYLSGEASFRFMVEDQGVHTTLSVPLFDAAGPIGAISVHRREVRLYSDDEIALIRNFAAQAVIAIENVRQFRELQERLAREAATREILQVISQSRDDEQPVFDVVVRKAADLCGAAMANLEIIGEDRSHAVMVAHWGDTLRHYVVGETAFPTDSELAKAIYSGEGRFVHVHDLADTDLYRSGDPIRVADVDKEGIRTFLAVPLYSGGKAVGCIALYRREVKPFRADEIALVETFAAQAVIAIENVHQFRELQTRLEREAASAEILEAISQNRDSEAPVFEVILRNVARLCATDLATLDRVSAEGTHLEYAAHWGAPFKSFEPGHERWPLDRPDQVAQSIREKRAIHTPDSKDTDLYRQGVPFRVQLVEGEGVRSRLTVPLITASREAIGVICLSRKAVAPFTPDEIALVETFAAQAVIAIENVRQFNALERLNAELGDRVQAQVGEIERMGRLKRFLPAAVADAVVSSGSEKVLGSHRALLGVLFCDIRGFTAFCETAEPEETIEVLQTYHEEMGRLIGAHGAGVDHRMGDGIMVLFNDPLPCDDPAGSAVRLAMAMKARMAELCQKWKKSGHRLGFGIGVSLGYATVGIVGSGGRFDYSASGSAVNLAARLCDDAKDGEILISPRVRQAVEGAFTVESRGEVDFKGIRDPVEVFCVTGIAVG